MLPASALNGDSAQKGTDLFSAPSALKGDGSIDAANKSVPFCGRRRGRRRALAVGAAEAAVVLGDGFFEAGGDLRRRLRADGGALGGVAAVAASLSSSCSARFTSCWNSCSMSSGLPVMLPRSASPSSRTARSSSSVRPCARSSLPSVSSSRDASFELLSRVVDRAGVVPEAAIARIPDAAAPPVVPVAGAAGAEAAVAIADLAAAHSPARCPDPVGPADLAGPAVLDPAALADPADLAVRAALAAGRLPLLARLALAGLPCCSSFKLPAQVLELRAQLGVRILLRALAGDGFRFGESLRFLGVAL